MQKQILLVQFRTDKSITLEQGCIFRATGIKKDSFKVINAFNQGIDFSVPEKILERTNKVILGGSGEFYFSGNKNDEKDERFWQMIKRIRPFIKYLLKNDIPTLGICFGHQLLAYNLGGKVIKDKKQQETGSFSVYLSKEGKSNPLFRSLSPKFIAQLGHKDSLEGLPKNSVLLAKSKKCKVQAFQHKKNIFGVQFHPEMTRKDVISRLKLYPDYSHKATNKERITGLKPSSYATKVLKKFCVM